MRKSLAFVLIFAITMTMTACGLRNTPEETTVATLESTAATEESTAPPEAAIPQGYYLMESMVQDGVTMDGTILSILDCYILINTDGTGIFSMTGISYDLTWTETGISLEGDTVPYTLEEDVLTILDDNVKLSFRYSGKFLPEEEAPFEEGYFVLSSVGNNGDVEFFSELNPENGYLRLNADGTGVLYYEGVEQSLTWDNQYLYCGEDVHPYTYQTYYDSELGRDDSLLMVYIMDGSISLALRPVEESGT